MPEALPSYRELPIREGLPPKSAWGLFGDDDQLGTLNLLTPERVCQAARLVRKGTVIALGLPLEEPRRPEGGRRGNIGHHMIDQGYGPDFTGEEADDETPSIRGRDDYVSELWLQGSSQWDGLTHVLYKGQNYNGVPDEDIHGGPGTKLGVDQWAAHGIVGRGVLLDVARYLHRVGRPLDLSSNYGITVEDLQATMAMENVEIQAGDIMLFRTGWVPYLVSADDTVRAQMLGSGMGGAKAPGLEVSDRMLEFLWDLHVSAIAADNMSVEQFPPPRPVDEFKMHKNWLPLWGMPLGEYWALDALAADCAEDGRYTFLLVSVPLNVRGGVGSPCQAVAIK